MSARRNLFALGAGYSVRPLLTRLSDEGWTVTATTRDAEKAETLGGEGLSGAVWEAPEPLPDALREAASRADVIVASLPPTAGCPALPALAGIPLRRGVRLLYLSSSSVYGNHGGAWVEETSDCLPATRRGQARLMAEGTWRAFAARHSAELTLCRLTGIYGPGRNAVDSLRGGTRGARAGLAQRVIKPGHVFSRIHRDDIASGLYALATAKSVPPIVNFADNEPSPPQDVIAYAAMLLGIAAPPEVAFEDADLSDMARSFYAENKRVRNTVLRTLPGFSLRYPTYREGLSAAF